MTASSDSSSRGSWPSLVNLVDKAGHVASNNDIVDWVWEGTHVGDEALTNAIRVLRKAFDDAKAPRVIETVPKRGYRLVAPVGERLRSAKTATTPRRAGAYLAFALAALAVVIVWLSGSTPSSPPSLVRFELGSTRWVFDWTPGVEVREGEHSALAPFRRVALATRQRYCFGPELPMAASTLQMPEPRTAMYRNTNA